MQVSKEANSASKPSLALMRASASSPIRRELAAMLLMRCGSPANKRNLSKAMWAGFVKPLNALIPSCST
jgi:hypothetical protein